MTGPELIHDWNVQGAPFTREKPVLLDDETLRDGLQSPSVVNPTIDEKVEILRLMARLGIQKADLGLPGAGPQHLDHIDRLLQVIVQEKLTIRPGLACRTLVQDIQPVADLMQKHGIPIQASAFLGSSAIRQYVEGWSVEHLKGTMEKALEFARDHQIPVMFVTEDTTRSRPEDLEILFGRALELGATGLCIADTVGHATPHGVKELVTWVRGLVARHGKTDQVEVNWHGHSDRGLAIANCLAAVEAGADVIHGTALGIGERAGNASMDQLLVNLKLLGLHDHELGDLGRYCQRVSAATGVPIPRNYPVVGSDAFETATGVHASAVIKALEKGQDWLADRVYSGVPATDFGFRQVIKVGPMSGRSNVVWWLKEHGHTPDDGLVMHLFEKAKASRTILEDAELEALVRQYVPARAENGAS